MSSLLTAGAQPVISAFTPVAGPVGTVVTIYGTNLTNISSCKLGNSNLAVLSANGSTMTAIVMPNCFTNNISVSTPTGTATSTYTFTVFTTTPPVAQESKLTGTGNAGVSSQGSVAISANGSTAVVGGYADNGGVGAAWIYERTGTTWAQQGSKLVGSGNAGTSGQGVQVSISADGNTVLMGGPNDNSQNGAAWIFVRNNGVWTQQGSKLYPNDISNAASFGQAVALSGDGNTAIIGALSDVSATQGEAWIFTRSNGVWTQQGSKLAVSGFTHPATNVTNRIAVAMSADGTTAAIGLSNDIPLGAAWVFARSGNTFSQQGTKLVGTGSTGTNPFQGYSVALSADGNYLLSGAPGDNGNTGATWVFNRVGGTNWIQQGSKLIGSGGSGTGAYQGWSVSLNAAGNVAAISAYLDNNAAGALWTFTRTTTAWTQFANKITATGNIGPPELGSSAAISGDGQYLIAGGINDNNNNGAAWVFTTPQIDISVAITDATCHQNDGSIVITATNGLPVYRYSFYPTTYQLPNNFGSIAPGTYTIIVRDTIGTSSYTVINVGSTCPAITGKTVVNDSCGTGRGSITVTAVRGTTPYQYSINGVSFQPSNRFGNLTAGTYRIIMEDASHFRDTMTNIVVSNSCLGIAIVSADVTCGGTNGSMTVTGSNGTAPYTYSLDGTTFQNSGNFKGLATGNYVITVKDAAGATGIGYDTIHNLAGPSNLQVTTTIALCNNTNGSITLAGTGGTAPLQYSIDGMHYQLSGQFTNDTAGIYTATVKDANGCIFTAAATVTKYPTPLLNLGKDTALCTGQSLVLQAGSGFATYVWSTGQTTPAQTVTSAGKYFVTATDVNNCQVSDTINITVQNLPVFSLGNDTSLCTSQSITLQIGASGTYLWSDASTQNKNTIHSAGTYWAQANNNGCVFRDTVLISAAAGPIVQLPADTILCNTASLLLSATQIFSNTVYRWQDGNTDPTYLVNTAGTYSVRVTANTCIAMDTIVVQYQSSPYQLIAKDTSKCTNTSIVLDVSFPNATYNWRDLNTLPVYTVTNAGVYYCTVSNYCGTSIDTIQVRDVPCECIPTAPNAFSPNGDGINDDFRPDIGCTPSSYHLRIFNRDGQIVFETTSLTNYWKGDYKGKPVPLGTYYYIIQVKGQSDNSTREKSGSLVLIR